MGREYELKFRADKTRREAIRQAYGPFASISMETTYYDTPDGALSRRRWTLRRRYENGVSVCTLKIPLPDGSRGEWETVCPEIGEAIPELCKLGGPEELLQLTRSGLKAVCGARFTRLAAQLTLGVSRIELALDEGILFGGGREQPLGEVEAELKEGTEEDVRRFGLLLARDYALTVEPESKYKRALALTKEKQE